jgi:DNA-binding XRE family transcriptional regulator
VITSRPDIEPPFKGDRSASELDSLAFWFPCPKARRVQSPGRQQRAPDVQYRMLVGVRLRHLRDEAGLSQQDLADSVDMSTRHLGGVERGQSNLSLDLLVRLADGLGVQPVELLPPRPSPEPAWGRGHRP